MAKMIVTIHQPEFMPYLGFFHKMFLADRMVLLDTVQFKKNNFQNRNRIQISGQPNWLSLPLEKAPLATLIKDIKINKTVFKPEKQLKTIAQNYGKHPFFSDLFPMLEKLYNENLLFLSEFNSEFIVMMAAKLGIKTETVLSSALGLNGKTKGGTEVTLEIAEFLNAKIYLSGSGGKTYLRTGDFEEKGIKVYFQEYKHPEYRQMNAKSFFPYLSVIDLYFNHGPESLSYILKDNIQKINDL
ncbi:MAG: WbqC family protein [Bacteroidales bacterium]